MSARTSLVRSFIETLQQNNQPLIQVWQQYSQYIHPPIQVNPVEECDNTDTIEEREI